MIEAWNKFWFRGPITYERLVAFRIAFFGVLAADRVMELPHAVRYGADQFNVSHFEALDPYLPIPTPAIMVVLYVVQAWLAAMIALGAHTRAHAWALAALFGASYFWSQIDSYQHHYFVFVLLLIAACGRWDGKTDDRWVATLLLAQTSVLYFWAAVAKMSWLWCDGHVLSHTLNVAWFHDLVDDLGKIGAVGSDHVWAAIAVSVIVLELFLAVAIHVPRLRWPAVVLGVAFHLLLDRSGFKIGLFSYYMLALYALVLPGTWPEAIGRALAPAAESLAPVLAQKALAVVGIVIGCGLWVVGIPIDTIVPGVVIIGVLTLADGLRTGRIPGLQFLVGSALLVAWGRYDEVAKDYWRFSGGDLRRRHAYAESIVAYERVVAIDPSYRSSWVHLGDLYATTGDKDKALSSYHIALGLQPDDDKLLATIHRLQDGGAVTPGGGSDE
ncbi:MAG: HTTM domain-containing protein [Hyphomicrobiales bacterium]